MFFIWKKVFLAVLSISLFISLVYAEEIATSLTSIATDTTATTATLVIKVTHPAANSYKPILPTKIPNEWYHAELLEEDTPISFIKAKGFTAN